MQNFPFSSFLIQKREENFFIHLKHSHLRFFLGMYYYLQVVTPLARKFMVLNNLLSLGSREKAP